MGRRAVGDHGHPQGLLLDATTRPGRPDCPPPVARGLSRVQAATYVGIGVSTFDKLVAEGTMPQPFRIGTRKLWDRLRLDLAFEHLQPDDGDDAPNPWENEP